MATINNNGTPSPFLDPATGTGNLTDMYLADRAAMLSWRLKVNTKDLVGDVAPYYQGNSWHFKDVTKGAQVWVGNPYDVKSDPGLREVIFGQIGEDALNGSDNGDHLYGGAGNDTLSGGKGNDYIEGQQGADSLKGEDGNDILVGGAGADNLDGGSDNDLLVGNIGSDTLNGGDGGDILLGGADNDTLDGGSGNDILKGGDGNDAYVFTGSYGSDIITDSDGSGTIKIEGQTLNTATQKFESIYKDDTSGYTFVKLNGGNSLVLLKEGEANRILVNDWSTAKNLGISLQGDVPAAPVATITGDFKKKIKTYNTADTSDDIYEMVGNNYAKDGDEVDALDLLNGTAGNDVIDGKGGDDALSGKEGDDCRMSRAANDNNYDLERSAA